MQQSASKLSNIFQDVNYAWQLLNAQIEIEMTHIVSGEVIAYLLQLYMRGVQRMNSIADPRQSYFKNKVTSLMTKQTVIKSLKQNPMKKKAKHDQVIAKQSPLQKQPLKQSKDKTPKKKKSKKQELKTIITPPANTLNPLELKQKKLQLQKRMAYVAQQHGPDSLKKIIAQQDHRQQNISSKISKIINSHQQKLNERIMARKLKTATFRTRSQVNMQQADMFHQNQCVQIQLKQQNQQFIPFQQIKLSQKKIQQSRQQNNSKLIQKTHRKYKSHEVVRNIYSPQKKIRKYTFDEQKCTQQISS